MAESILANIQQEGDAVDLSKYLEETNQAPVELEKTGTETPAVSPAETKPTGQTASPAEGAGGETTPKTGETTEEPAVYHAFHEHPRWIAREQELKELREQNEELQAFRERMEPILGRFESQEKVDKTIPEWFSNLYGEDEKSWEKYQEFTATERTKLKDELLIEFAPLLETTKKSRFEEELKNWADGQWRELESDPQVQTELKKMGLDMSKAVQEEIGQIMSRFLPSDEAGNISLRRSYEIWKELKKISTFSDPNVAAKKRAADIAGKPNPAGEQKDYKTSSDFVGKSIVDLIA